MIISGATGFIGSNIVNGFHFDGYDQVLGVSSKYYYSIIKNKKIKISKKEFNKVTSENVLIDFLHLATFFSFQNEDKEKIYDANIKFGKDIISNLEYSKIRKIVYTNTVYSFSNDKKIKSSDYVITKNMFSNYLNELSKKYNFSFVEVFIHNTFGEKDKRNKIIPIIFKSILLEEPNPIQNKDAYLNLIHVEDFINLLPKFLKCKSNKKYAVLSKMDFNLQSIYDFCLNSDKKENKNVSTKISDLKSEISEDTELIIVETNIEPLLIESMNSINKISA